MTTARVPGHSLVSEGAPFTAEDRRDTQGYSWLGTAGPGRALCSCGELSEPLASVGKRKQWHREHKDAVSTLSGQKE